MTTKVLGIEKTSLLERGTESQNIETTTHKKSADKQDLPVDFHSVSAAPKGSYEKFKSGLDVASSEVTSAAGDNDVVSAAAAPSAAKVLLPKFADVVIVGGGPAGLMLGVGLARSGISHVIVDHSRPEYPESISSLAAATNSDKKLFFPSQSIVLHPDTLAVLEAYGLADDLIVRGRTLKGATVISEGNVVANTRFGYFRTGKRSISGGVPVNKGSSGFSGFGGDGRFPQPRFPYGLVIEQWQVERVLSEALVRSGGKILRSHVAWKIEAEQEDVKDEIDFTSLRAHQTGSENSNVNDYRVSVWVKPLEPITRHPLPGDGHLIQARFIVGADGAYSIVRRAFEIEFPARSSISDYLCADIVIAAWNKQSVDGLQGESSVAKHLGVTTSPSVVVTAVSSAVGETSAATSLPDDARAVVLSKGGGLEIPSSSTNAPLSSHVLIIHSAHGSILMFPFKAQNVWRLVCRREPAATAEESRPPPQYPSKELDKHFVIHRLEQPTIDEVQDIFDALLPGTVIGRLDWKTAYSTCYRIADTFKRERAFLIGDAAHNFSPLWGEGLNQAIQDAENLRWKLAAVLGGGLSSSSSTFLHNHPLLKSYDEERRYGTARVMEYCTSVRDSLLDINRLTSSCQLIPVINRFVAPVWNPDVLNSIIVSPASIYPPLSRALCDITDFYPASSDFAVHPGMPLPDCRVLNLSFSSGRQSPAQRTSLTSYVKPESHTIFLILRILPAGTKFRTVFGCDRQEEAPRFSNAGLTSLVALAKWVKKTLGASLSRRGVFIGSDASPSEIAGKEVFGSGLRICWILTSLISGPAASIQNQTLKNMIPQLLRTKLAEAFPNEQMYVAVDKDNEVIDSFNLNLTDLSAPSISIAEGLKGLFQKKGSPPPDRDHRSKGEEETTTPPRGLPNNERRLISSSPSSRFAQSSSPMTPPTKTGRSASSIPGGGVPSDLVQSSTEVIPPNEKLVYSPSARALLVTTATESQTKGLQSSCGAFLLVRPDSKIAGVGYVDNNNHKAAVIDYVTTNFYGQ